MRKWGRRLGALKGGCMQNHRHTPSMSNQVGESGLALRELLHDLLEHLGGIAN
jgi:hypothetical protein